MKTFSFTLTLAFVLNSSAWAIPMIVPKNQKDAVHKAAFEKNWKRYPSPETILQTLKSQFPRAEYVNYECNSFTATNRQILGDNSPALGKPLSANPDPAFAVWYADCLVDYIGSEGTAARSESFEAETAKTLAQEYMFKDPVINNDLDFLTFQFHELTKEQQEKIVKGIIEKHIGPEEVWAELGFDNPQNLITDILEQLEVFHEKNPGLKDKFYEDSGIISTYQKVSYLILMQDVLQY